MTPRPLLLAACALLCLALAACVNEAEPAIGGPPTAPAAHLDDDLRALSSGVVDISIAANGVTDLDPLNIAINLGVMPPACADFVMVFTWQIVEPDPAGDARVGFLGQRMGGRFEVASPAASGQASVGCALLQAVNQSAAPVSVQLRFTVASTRR